MKAFNARKGKYHRFGRYDGIKAIIDSNLIYSETGEFHIEDYYVENYKDGANYGHPINECCVERSIKAYFGSYRNLWRTHNEGRAFSLVRPYKGEEDEIFALVRLSDISTVLFNKYVILKKGGVFNLDTGNWYKKSEFFKALSIYSNQKYLRGVAAFDYILFEVYIGNGDELDISYIHSILNAEVSEDDEEGWSEYNCDAEEEDDQDE